MRKQLILTFSAILVVAILTVGFSSRAANTPMFEVASGEKNTSLRAQSLTAITKEIASFDATPTLSAGEETVAVEVREGGSASFRGLSITLVDVQERASCVSGCLEVRAQLSVGTGNGVTVSGGEGEEFLHEGYSVKVSQIAPKEIPPGVSRRVVFLLSVAE